MYILIIRVHWIINIFKLIKIFYSFITWKKIKFFFQLFHACCSDMPYFFWKFLWIIQWTSFAATIDLKSFFQSLKFCINFLLLLVSTTLFRSLMKNCLLVIAATTWKGNLWSICYHTLYHKLSIQLVHNYQIFMVYLNRYTKFRMSLLYILFGQQV